MQFWTQGNILHIQICKNIWARANDRFWQELGIFKFLAEKSNSTKLLFYLLYFTLGTNKTGFNLIIFHLNLYSRAPCRTLIGRGGGGVLKSRESFLKNIGKKKNVLSHKTQKQEKVFISRCHLQMWRVCYMWGILWCSHLKISWLAIIVWNEMQLFCFQVQITLEYQPK